ncbi:MAG: hypothetical protein HQL46_07880, partial [Gammaproteobacteria bacterium]|nr:hypothetical protein [Gammaproteobacteria bacterium]
MLKAEVVLLEGKNPSSADILNAFNVSDDMELMNDLPEGLLEGLGEGVSNKRFKGISYQNMTQSKQPTCPKNTNTIALNIN